MRTHYKLTISLAFLLSCEDSSPDNAVQHPDDRSRIENIKSLTKGDDYYHSDIIMETVKRLKVIDQKLESDFFSDLNDGGYHQVSKNYKDSVDKNFSFVSDSMSNSIMGGRDKEQFEMLMNNLHTSFNEIINNLDEINVLLYPQSARVGYSERNTILYFLMNEYLKYDLREMMEEYEDYR